jgi:hypothetical protein
MKNWKDRTLDEKVEIWENVARVLANLTPHERKNLFDMSWWGVKEPCGTIACAAGYCGMDSWFRRRGVSLKRYKSESEDGTLSKHMEFLDSDGAYVNVEDFFGPYGFDVIFCDDSPRTVAEVEREVRSYINALKVDRQRDWMSAMLKRSDEHPIQVEWEPLGD